MTAEAAAPGTRTLLELNETLTTLDPAQGPSAFTALEPQRVAKVVEAFEQSSAKMSTVLRTEGRLVQRDPCEVSIRHFTSAAVCPRSVWRRLATADP
ncbi:hypothetical protein [Streptomyces sp. NPDC004014]